MTSRERLMTVLNHKEADRVPLDLGGGAGCNVSLGLYKNF
jgi:uroporphyrinogen decarboxylase